MDKSLSLILVVVGVVLLVLGINASDSFASQISEFFSGSPTDEAVWMMIGGVVALLVGAFGLLRGSKRT